MMKKKAEHHSSNIKMISAPHQPSFIITSDDDDDDDDDQLQISDHLRHAFLCRERNADYSIVALPDHQPTARHVHTEKVDDNFHESSESRASLLQDELQLDVNSSTMLIMGHRAKIESSWDYQDPPIIINGHTPSTMVGLCKEVDPLLQCCTRAPVKKLTWPDRSCNIPAQLQEKCEAQEEEEACVTPRATEQRIPHETLICPPPPCKKRRTQLSLRNCRAHKRLSYAMPPSSSASSAASASSSRQLYYQHLQRQYGAAAGQVVVNPPDLHTFPACIRALFFHNT